MHKSNLPSLLNSRYQRDLSKATRDRVITTRINKWVGILTGEAGIAYIVNRPLTAQRDAGLGRVALGASNVGGKVTLLANALNITVMLLRGMANTIRMAQANLTLLTRETKSHRL